MSSRLFHYTVFPETHNRKYSVTENEWRKDTKSLSETLTMKQLSGREAKAFFGFCPSLYGMKKSMWLYIPAHLQEHCTDSPLSAFLEKPIPVEDLRFFPPEDQDLESQAAFRPALYAVAEPLKKE